MQTYPGRDPLAEALAGEITVRKLRVMLEHLPPGNAAARELSSPWDDRTWLLHSIDSRLAVLNAQFYNAHLPKDARAVEPRFRPTPDEIPSLAERQHEQEMQARQRADMQAVLARPNPH